MVGTAALPGVVDALSPACNIGVTQSRGSAAVNPFTPTSAAAIAITVAQGVRAVVTVVVTTG